MNPIELSRRAPPEVSDAFDVGAPDALNRMIELFGRHGNIYRMYVPARRSYTYVIHHPDDVRHVLLSNHRNYTKGADRDRIKILLGIGLMTSEGPNWTRHHNMIQPLFHRRIITQFDDAMRRANERFLVQLAEHVRNGRRVNITEAMSELTLDVVLNVIFGEDAPRVVEPFSILTHDSARNLEFVYKFRALGALVKEIMLDRKASEREYFDYLHMMMQARDKDTSEGMTDREIVDEILTLVVAGHETTASVLNWTWYLLSQHTDVEARLFDEISSCVEDEDDESGLAGFNELAYTRRVINEVMRLYPPGWLLSRRSVRPDVLAGCEIPAGANVLIPLFLVHRHPSYWRDAEHFDPDRFDPANEAQQCRYAYVPFSAGPRHCIGETLALYEMLFHLRMLVPRYRLVYVPTEPIELEAQINLRSRHCLTMRVERR